MGAPGAFGLLVWGPGREVVRISSNPPPLEIYPKTSFSTGASFEMKNGRGSRERFTSMNAREWVRRPTKDKENPGPATSRHAYNYTEMDEKSAQRCTVYEVGLCGLVAPRVSVEVCYVHMGVPGFGGTPGGVFGKRPARQASV